MRTTESILKSMIENELGENRAYVISHHQAENPNRIDVARDETVFIHNISVQASIDFWLEFHSATDSRLIEKQLSSSQLIEDDIISRHKGSINFSQSHAFDYKVQYVKIKIVK
ncbi:MAG: hypothetical protein C0596_16105 [Marinilabiliales bacterium]|nr:MAG: hypothetical protein C0596_16105 [Marinilabiliales bacterium]